MKIYCDKCGKDITDVVSKTFETNMVGNVICPHCQKAQKRYLSETDFLMYLAFQETLYFVLSFITSQLFLHYKVNIWMILIFTVALILSVIATAKFKSIVYNTGLIKNSTMYKARIEDQKKVARSIRWQFLMFFALVITFFTETTAYWFFVAASITVVALTILRAILSARNEK